MFCLYCYYNGLCVIDSYFVEDGMFIWWWCECVNCGFCFIIFE